MGHANFAKKTSGHFLIMSYLTFTIRYDIEPAVSHDRPSLVLDVHGEKAVPFSERVQQFRCTQTCPACQTQTERPVEEFSAARQPLFVDG